MKEGTRIVSVKVASIKMDSELQPREAITDEAVEEYAEAMKAGVEFPPCVVVKQGKTHWLCDGFHRVAAAARIKRKAVKCEVIEGNRQQAIWLASAANLTHGVRRTNADKRRAVHMALGVKGDLPLRDIADHCAVSYEMVRVLKSQAEATADVQRHAEQAVAKTMKDQDADTRDELAIAMMMTESVIARAIRGVDGCITAITALCQTKHAIFVNEQSVLNDLRNAKNALKYGIPHERCPLCGGVGCETCRQVGWVSKRQWDLIPKTQRKE